MLTYLYNIFIIFYYMFFIYVSGKYYQGIQMTEITQFDNPNDIESMDTLKIKAATGNLSPKIYGNGQNQLEVEITAKATKEVDGENKPLHFSQDTWIRILNLRYAKSDETLNRNGDSDWCFTGAKNDYCGEVGLNLVSKPSFSVQDDGTIIIFMYVYCNLTKGETMRIAVSVDTDNRHFTTADVADGEKIFVTVNALPKIDYSLRQNIKVSGMPTSIEDFRTIDSRMIVMQSPASMPYYIGISSKTRFTIKVALEQYGYVFKLVNPIRNNVEFSSCKFPAQPDMIRGTEGNSFDAQFVFVNQKTYGLNCSSQFDVKFGNVGVGLVYHYKIGPTDERHHFNEDVDNGSIRVDICNHRVPWGRTHPYKWGDQGKLIKINVMDNYGNSGIVTIENPNKDGLWPKLYVNGE